MTIHHSEPPRRSPNAPLTGWGMPTHYRASGGEVSVITDPFEVAIATIGAIRALAALAIRYAWSDPDQRSEP